MRRAAGGLLLALLLGLSAALPAWAGVPIAYRAADGDSWARIALRHGVSVAALRAANPGLDAARGWVRLPDAARLPDAPSIALLASAYQEISAIVEDAQIDAVYRIVGREFHVGRWAGANIVAGVAGGNMDNAAIGATVLLQHFNVRALGFVGIAGGGGATRVGDVIVAAAAVQHDQGNWYDFALDGGQTFAGLSWQMRGQPLLSDAGRVARLVLQPDPALLARIGRSVAGLELPPIGDEVAAFHGVAPYRPALWLDGWSASGSQFITSHHARSTIERRMALAAQRLDLPPPPRFVVDQEDFAAVLASEEHGVPWFIVRVVVDLAAQKSAAAGIPLALYDRPEEIPAWLAANGQQSHAKHFDWSYFYRLIALTLRPVVHELGAAADDDAPRASGAAAAAR
ncbi:phosphorylase family protein [Solimonas flava]|uniref:phosphorylase family protein n=1 Tax=Solimonas flava TaxID=415849 RepID=UPI000400CCDD|nr:LysM peptidoglycan-binding domain-containing protein [Solimonas flava]